MASVVEAGDVVLDCAADLRVLRCFEGETCFIPAGAEVNRAWYGNAYHSWDARHGKNVLAIVSELHCKGLREMRVASDVFGNPNFGAGIVKVLLVELRTESTQLFNVAAFSGWKELLVACEPFARDSGGRYTSALFGDLRGDGSTHDKVRVEATPTVAKFVDYVATTACSMENSTADLVCEFKAAEVMVMREAVFRSMCATCRAAGLWPVKADVGVSDITYHDTSEPLERIAARLFNFVEHRRREGEEDQHTQTIITATFIVEFGRENGLIPSPTDSAAEQMLMSFLLRVKEWGERSGRQDIIPCLEAVPKGSELRVRAEDWWRAHRKGIVVGVGIIAGTAAMLATGRAMYSVTRAMKCR